MNIFGTNNGKVNINVNGRSINISGGSNITINNGQVFVDGKPYVEKAMGQARPFCWSETFKLNFNKVVVKAKSTNVKIQKGEINSIKYAGDYYGNEEPHYRLMMEHSPNYGEMEIWVDHEDIITKNSKLIITLKSCDDITIENASGNIVLNDVDADSVSLTNASGNTHCDGSTDVLTIESKSGDVNFHGDFDQATLKTMSGDMEIGVLNKNNCQLIATAMSGDIGIMADAFENFNINTSTMSGKVKNRVRRIYPNKNTLTANLQTMSGDICIDEM